MKNRGSGILLHITSLPSLYGVGDLGPGAYQFADFLSASKQRYWQILPLNPTGTYLGNSPYTSYSAFAGNPLLISPEMLIQQGLLTQHETEDHRVFSASIVDYPRVIAFKSSLLRLAYNRFKSRMNSDQQFIRFCEVNSYWLEDYSLFGALKEKFEEVAWDEWPENIRDREIDTLKILQEEVVDRISMSKFFQFVFFKQWFKLKDYCSSKNVQIIGDIPIYPSIDSADAWANPAIFKLDNEKRPIFVAGAPPDYFSATGQRWGNPVYRWDYLKETHYHWWIKRIGHNLKMFPVVRLDHFRGMVAYWEIPAEEETAVKGKWVEVPTMDFFNTVLQNFWDLPLIVEDLGLITSDVRQVMDHFGFPGMKVLLFAFGHDLPTNPYAPHNYVPNCVVYTGTHDNNTIQGWFQNEASGEDRQRLLEYIGRTPDSREIHWEVIRLALSSVANTAIIPMQDILGLGEEARMNLPSQPQGNWGWRVLSEQLTSDLANKLARMTWLYNRAQQ